MSVSPGSPDPASLLGFRRVPYVPCGLAVALVLLRLCIGWHFYREGTKKIAYNPATGESRVAFNAEPILKSAVGPLAPTIKASLPNFHEWERLLVVPRETAPVDAAKEAAWRSEDGKRRQTALDKKEQPTVEFYPELPYAAWAARVAADWQAGVDRFKAIDYVTDEQRAAAQEALDARVTQLSDYLADERTAIGDWQHELWRLGQWEQAPGATGVPFEQARIVEKRGETAAASAGWVAQVRELEQGLAGDLRNLLTTEQAKNASLVDQADAALADPQERDLHRLNVAVTWLVTGIGVCLLLGLFTRLASVAGILFLLSIIATQPPWVDGAITTVFYYQLVEIMAFVVLFASGAGRWAGLDHFLYAAARVLPAQGDGGFMNLTPEQREIGKQNFYESVGTTRREFLKGTVLAAGVAGGSLGAMYFGYGAKVEKPLRVGIVGTGDEGGVLIGSLNPDYIDVVAIADIRPYNRHRAFHGDINNAAARPGLMSVYKWKTEDEARNHVKVYEDAYEDLLNDENVEAIIIALPLWLHDVCAIKAMQKGKHVLTEKLMAQSVARCKEMGRFAEQARATSGDPIVIAVGHQRHYSILYANAVDQIRQGILGELHHIRAQWHRANVPGSDSWSPSLPCPLISQAEFDKLKSAAKKKGGAPQLAAVEDEYKMLRELINLEGTLKKTSDVKEADALAKKIADKKIQFNDATVDAAKYGYQTKTLESGRERPALEELIRWRLWDRTAAGLMAELGSHQLDASSIFVTAQGVEGHKLYPLSVQGIGFRSIFPADRDVDDHVHCNYEFPGKGYYEDMAAQDKVADPHKKIVVTYSSINGNDYGGYGEVVMGTKGTLILDREQEALLFMGGNANTKIEVKDGKDGKPAMNTYETGGGAAVAQAATPKNVSRGYKEEIEHWAWCIRNPSPENQPKCTPKVAMADAIIALTSNRAIRERTRIEFDKDWFDVHNDKTPDDSTVRPMSDLPRKLDDLA